MPKEGLLVCDILKPDMVKLPCGLLIAQANEGGGGGRKTPRHAPKTKDEIISLSEILHLHLLQAMRKKKKSLVDARVGRYGLTV